MATKKPFEVDITDLDTVRAKLAEAEDKLEEKREMVREAQRDFAYWQAVVERLRLIAGTPREAQQTNNPRDQTAHATVYAVVEATDRPLRAADVMQMSPILKNRNTVSYSLWQLAKEGSIQRLGQGLYARRDYRPPEEQEALAVGES